MRRVIKLLLIAGARPNFMKIAPLIRAIECRRQQIQTPHSETPSPISYKLVHTGQHYDAKMSEVFFRELGIPAPDINLDVGSGSHAVQTAKVMSRFESVCIEENPDWVVVVGDVNSTLACTLVASKLGVKVAHVEAGLRSFDRTMPEEINRLVTDTLADLLLTPSHDANENLRREGVPEQKIKLVGNIMIDALVSNLEKAHRSSILSRLGLDDHAFVYVTLHRPSNVDQKETLAAIMTQLVVLSKQTTVIFPMHPRTRKMLDGFKIPLDGAPCLKVMEPVGYHDSLCLTEKARLVLTDSGGLQEESTYFRTPCLTLRPNTERPVTVAEGSNRLTDPQRLAADLETVLAMDSRLGQVPRFWDGHTAERVMDALIAS